MLQLQARVVDALHLVEFDHRIAGILESREDGFLILVDSLLVGRLLGLQRSTVLPHRKQGREQVGTQEMIRRMKEILELLALQSIVRREGDAGKEIGISNAHIGIGCDEGLFGCTHVRTAFEQRGRQSRRQSLRQTDVLRVV